MSETPNFPDLMSQKGAKMVDTIFQARFGHIPQDNLTSFASEDTIADLMLQCYLEGVKASLTENTQYFELDGFIKALFG